MGEAVAAVCVLAWLAALAVYDVRQRRLPNALTLPGAVAVLIAAALAGRGVPALLGALVLTALYLGVHLVAPVAMGAGDVKLAIGVGALTGAFGVDAWVLAAIGAPLLTALWGIVVVQARGTGASEATGGITGASEATGGITGASEATGGITVPHGPSMCVATLAAVALVVL
jgi:leader peptidase (prepilin peptidase)/N-methyltransferase